MAFTSYTEETLLQQTTAEYFEKQLGWELIYTKACNLPLPRLINGEVAV